MIFFAVWQQKISNKIRDIAYVCVNRTPIGIIFIIIHYHYFFYLQIELGFTESFLQSFLKKLCVDYLDLPRKIINMKY